MTSEIRANKQTNRAGLGTVTYADTGIIVSGIVTCTELSGLTALNIAGVGTASTLDINGDIDVDGHTNLDNVSIAGITTAFRLRLEDNRYLQIGDDSDLQLYHDGNNSYINDNGTGSLFIAGSAVRMQSNDNRLNDANGNVIIKTDATTAYLYYEGSNRLNTTSAGVNIPQDLDVDGHTNLDNVSIAGVVTATSFSGPATQVTVSDESSDTNTFLVFTNGATGNQTAHTGTNLTFNSSTGNLSATKFTGDGSGLTGITASGSGVVIKHDGSTVGTAGTINFGTNLDVSAISGGAVTITASGGGSGISTISGVVNIANDLDVDGHTEFDNVNVSGISTFNGDVQLGDSSILGLGDAGFSGGVPDLRFYHNGNSSNIANRTGNFFISQSHATDGLYIKGPLIVLRDPNNNDMIRGTASGVTINPTAGGVTLKHNGNQTKLETSASGVTVTGTLAATAVTGDGSGLTGIDAGVGITTNLSGSFTASAGSPSTINTFGYGSGDIVVEYTVFIKNGSNFQSQKLLAMRDGTTIHSTQFAIMFSSSLLVQLDATISGGNILLRATPETGVSGSTTYKIKREVM